MKIGLIPDTHWHLDEAVFKHFKTVDEIWHAGDVGNIEILNKLENFKPVRGVFGNIDGHEIRAILPETNTFETEGLKVTMIHIGGYPGRYAPNVRALLPKEKPGLFICGHSHILKAIPDKTLNLLHLNPGAAGKEGFHRVKTLMRFEINNGKIENLEAIELGLRGKIEND